MSTKQNDLGPDVDELVSALVRGGRPWGAETIPDLFGPWSEGDESSTTSTSTPSDQPAGRVVHLHRYRVLQPETVSSEPAPAEPETEPSRPEPSPDIYAMAALVECLTGRIERLAADRAEAISIGNLLADHRDTLSDSVERLSEMCNRLEVENRRLRSTLVFQTAALVGLARSPLAIAVRRRLLGIIGDIQV